MGCWIPGPINLCWPATRKYMAPNTPHEAAIANRTDEAVEKPKRTRRSTKKAEN